MLYRPSSIEQLESHASALMARTDFVFSDFCSLFAGFNKNDACQLFNRILEDVLNQTLLNGKPAYSEQTHLASQGDFNLALKIVGEGDARQEQTICASEFDMVLVSLSDTPFSLPVYRTNIDPSTPHLKPEPLALPYRMNIEPYHPYLFEAYTDITDLDFASIEAPALVVHSKPRAPATWVFDRQSGEPLHLTDNDLQRSRVQLAVRVIGDTGSTKQLTTLKQLAFSDYNHVVRWEAAESVYKLDEQQGIELLQQHLIDDNNSSIAKAARATLANLAQEAAS